MKTSPKFEGINPVKPDYLITMTSNERVQTFENDPDRGTVTNFNQEV